MKEDVDTYIAAAPKAAQPRLRELRRVIKAAAPEAEERISYGMPYYRFHGHLVYFAIHSAHIGLYPAGQTDKATELKKYVTGKGTFQFPLDRPMPMEKISRLIKRRAKELEAKART